MKENFKYKIGDFVILPFYYMIGTYKAEITDRGIWSSKARNYHIGANFYDVKVEFFDITLDKVGVAMERMVPYAHLLTPGLRGDLEVHWKGVDECAIELDIQRIRAYKLSLFSETIP